MSMPFLSSLNKDAYFIFQKVVDYLEIENKTCYFLQVQYPHRYIQQSNSHASLSRFKQHYYKYQEIKTKRVASYHLKHLHSCVSE